jgi:hypothetical protein
MESWHTTNHMIWVFEKIGENEDEQSHQSLVVNGLHFPGCITPFSWTKWDLKGRQLRETKQDI